MFFTKLAEIPINAYVGACYRKMLSEIIVSPLCYECSVHCPPQEPELEKDFSPNSLARNGLQVLYKGTHIEYEQILQSSW